MEGTAFKGEFWAGDVDIGVISINIVSETDEVTLRKRV